MASFDCIDNAGPGELHILQRGIAGLSQKVFNVDDHAFAMKIASALKVQLKGQNSRAKLVARWTGANEHTVKNWILGRYAPSGRHLVALAQHSDQVLNAILSMADRQDLHSARKIEDLRRKLIELAAIFEERHGLGFVTLKIGTSVEIRSRDGSL
jgi:hypothetical protein